MVGTKSDSVGEEESSNIVSMPLWIQGLLDPGDHSYNEISTGMSWYCVDVAVDDLFLQREIRLSNKQQSIRHNNKSIDHHKNLLTDGNPIFLKKRDKLGLEILPELIPVSLGNHGVPSTIVALGSFIYSASDLTYAAPREFRKRKRSDSCRLSKNLYCLDTKNKHQGWKTFKMITGRLDPLMAILDGKIYIMGGKHDPYGDLHNENVGFGNLYNENDSGGGDGNGNGRHYDADGGPWGEVFDPATGKSEPMSDIPDEFWEEYCSSVPDEFRKEYCTSVRDDSRHKILNERNMVVFTNKNSIVLCSSGFGWRIYYEINKQSWSNVVVDKVLASHTHWPCNFIHTEAYVVVGTTMYWISGMLGLSAYDFTTRRLYKSGDIDKYICKGWRNYYGNTKLIHLNGDNFCIVWVINKSAGNYEQIRKKKKDDVQINCTKVKIRCMDDNSESLSVSLLCQHIYVVDNRFIFNNALLVDA
ncbi:hypothetical protein LguiB_030750 [Lonicera macranthoides]